LNDYDMEPDEIFDSESISKLNITIEKNKNERSRMTLKSLKKNSKSDISKREHRLSNIFF